MGNCSSCLGERHRSVYDEDEESRLLFEDADGNHYGSFGEQSMSLPDGGQESQREFEALQRVVARTSNNMVDVFEIAPQNNLNQYGIPSPYMLGIHDNRPAQYQNLLARLSANETDQDVRIEDYPEPATSTVEVRRGSLLERAAVAGPFVGNFADAARITA